MTRRTALQFVAALFAALKGERIVDQRPTPDDSLYGPRPQAVRVAAISQSLHSPRSEYRRRGDRDSAGRADRGVEGAPLMSRVFFTFALILLAVVISARYGLPRTGPPR